MKKKYFNRNFNLQKLILCWCFYIFMASWIQIWLFFLNSKVLVSANILALAAISPSMDDLASSEILALADDLVTTDLLALTDILATSVILALVDDFTALTSSFCHQASLRGWALQHHSKVLCSVTKYLVYT